jgi:phage baseplate assembly protein V
MSIVTDAERAVQGAVRSVRNRVNNMLRRAVIKLVDDAKKQQELQVELFKDDDPEETETQDEVENFAHAYGMTAHAPADSEALLARLGGTGDTQVVIGTAHRQTRPKLEAEGDVTIYDKDGQKFELKRTKIVITLNGANTLELGAGASLGVARNTDPVQAIIPAGTVIVEVTGGGGAPAVGVLNPTDIPLDGTIQDGSSVVLAVD